jgi:hypothetical protein
MINKIALAVALLLSAVAAYYSIAGLAAIFSGAVVAIVLMGASLELGKVVTASWLYRNWDICPRLIKWYLSFSVVVLMFVTSMGIFGFLSKAHIEHSSSLGDSVSKLEICKINEQLERDKITDARRVLEQLDKSVEVLTSNNRLRGSSGAIAVRSSQKQERQQLTETIANSNQAIAKIKADCAPLEKEVRGVEAEVGPIKYVAELIYGETNDQLLDKAVRWVIIVLVFVFDPLAILLLIAANVGLSQKQAKFEIVNGKLQKVFK